MSAEFGGVKIGPQRRADSASAHLQPPGASSFALVNDLDLKLGGAFPLSLRAWYTHIGAVDLRGTHHRLCPVPNGDDNARELRLADPLVIVPIEWLLESFSDWSSGIWGEQPFKLELWPDDLHKANLSGGSYDIALSGPCGDAVLLDWHSFYFVDYLRCVFEWGWFPGSERYPNAPTDEIEYLIRDLLTL